MDTSENGGSLLGGYQRVVGEKWKAEEQIRRVKRRRNILVLVNKGGDPHCLGKRWSYSAEVVAETKNAKINEECGRDWEEERQGHPGNFRDEKGVFPFQFSFFLSFVPTSFLIFFILFSFIWLYSFRLQSFLSSFLSF